eukprot:symbB.v1.2.010216.t1/scaffold665.1/size175136/7
MGSRDSVHSIVVKGQATRGYPSDSGVDLSALKRRTNAITAFGKTLAWQRALNELHNPGDLDIALLNAVVSALSRAAQWQQAWHVLHHVQVAVQRDAVTFNSAQVATLRAEQWQRALQMSQHGTEHGILGDMVTPNLMIKAFGEAKLWREAILSISTISVRSVATSVDACKEAEEWKSSFGLLEQAMVFSIQMNVILVNTLISCAGSVSRWTRALLMCHSLGGGVRRDIITQNACLTALEVAGCWEAAQDLLVNSRSCSFTANLTSKNSALKALVYQRRWRLACASIATGSLAPDLVTYSAAAHVCGHSMVWAGTLNLLTEALQVRLLVDGILLRTAISACEISVQKNWHRRFVERMLGLALPKRIAMHEGLALVVRKWAFVSRVQSENIACNSLLSAYEKGRCWRLASCLFGVHASSQQTGPVSQLAVKAVVAACRGAGTTWPQMLQLLDIEADAVTLEAVLSLELGGEIPV